MTLNLKEVNRQRWNYEAEKNAIDFSKFSPLIEKESFVNAEPVSAMESPRLFGAGNRLKLAISMLLWKQDEIV